MSNQSQWQNHPSNPAAQVFNVSPRRNTTKKNSWWNPMSGTYWVKKRKSIKTVSGVAEDHVPGLPVNGEEG